MEENRFFAHETDSEGLELEIRLETLDDRFSNERGDCGGLLSGEQYLSLRHAEIWNAGCGKAAEWPNKEAKGGGGCGHMGDFSRDTPRQPSDSVLVYTSSGITTSSSTAELGTLV